MFTAKLPVSEFPKTGKIWKELDQTKRMQPTAIFSDPSFRSYSSLNITCLKTDFLLWHKKQQLFQINAAKLPVDGF
jgi:hypothetical protein